LLLQEQRAQLQDTLQEMVHQQHQQQSDEGVDATAGEGAAAAAEAAGGQQKMPKDARRSSKRHQQQQQGGEEGRGVSPDRHKRLQDRLKKKKGKLADARHQVCLMMVVLID
jgi:hypothetical protein